MKKILKNAVSAVEALIFVVFIVFFICSAAFMVYFSKIDANVDFDALMASRGLTSILYYVDENGNAVEMSRLHGSENRIFTDYENIPRHVIDAFLSIEDHRFFDHSGIDVGRTLGAALDFIKPSGASFGGSTITQQLIKNLTGDNGFTVKRKITEIKRALALEKRISKADILEAYMNTVYLSNGCYGVETAAEYFFSKSASELTLAEGASLAAILKYPYKYDPVRNPEENVARRNVVLERMYELGTISKEELEKAKGSELKLNLNQKQTEGRHLSWFEETVIDDVAADLCEKYGYDKRTAVNMIYSGGLQIVTTIDCAVQSALDEIYKNEKNFPSSGVLTAPESAAVIVDPHSGALLAVAGSRGEKTSDRILSYATRLTRSPGSVIKPLSVYAPALDKGIITWASVYDDVPVVFEQTDDGYTAWPKNNPRVYSGLTNINHAVESSINTVSVRVLRDLGVKTSFDFLKKLGISTLVERKLTSGGIWASDVAEAPLALGATTDGCTLYQMTGAYTLLADGGKYHKIHSYTEVYDRNGNMILEKTGAGEQMISCESADIMTRMLENVVKSGTGKGMAISRRVPVAGKTGTSNADTDRWFIGYTPDYICGIWYGYVDARDIGYFKMNPACTVFDKVMNAVYDNTPEKEKNEFCRSDNVVPCLYCRDSGLLASEACLDDPRGNRIELGYFHRGTEPQSHCDRHICVDYDDDTGGVLCGLESDNGLRVALVKNYSRSFPCPVTITDAQYTYRYLSPLVEPSQNEGDAYFQVLEKDGEYFGTSGVEKAFNRAKIPEKEQEKDETSYEDVMRRLFGLKR